MMTTTKTFTFAAAHVLTGHNGLCKNVHGHNYTLEIEVGAAYEGLVKGGPSDGMVMDFSDIKEVVNTKIIDVFDHSFIANQMLSPGLELDMVMLLQKHGSKVVLMRGRPTAENMVNVIVEILSRYLNVTRVRLWETSTSYAEVLL